MKHVSFCSTVVLILALLLCWLVKQALGKCWAWKWLEFLVSLFSKVFVFLSFLFSTGCECWWKWVVLWSLVPHRLSSMSKKPWCAAHSHWEFQTVDEATNTSRSASPGQMLSLEMTGVFGESVFKSICFSFFLVFNRLWVLVKVSCLVSNFLDFMLKCVWEIDKQLEV